MTVAQAVSTFGAAVKSKLSNPAIGGSPEDQLRGPLETLLTTLAQIAGHAHGTVHLVGETSLADIKTRPDYAVTAHNALVGFVEVKAPGKGADPRRFTDKHDREQWERLKSLPNLVYTDGNAFSLWRDGRPAASVVRLDGDVETAGAKLAAPTELLMLVADFLSWAPIPPKTAQKLAEVSARLCRLLRDQVEEQLLLGAPALKDLANEWRALLFPHASDAEFADGYAQAVTFGLLVARARDIPLAGGVEKAALELRKTNSLIGTALRLLTDNPDNQKALKTSLDTLTRVLGAVDWHAISKDKPEAWLYFYEQFLDVYDKALKKETGSYYTPPEVVESMVRLVDNALKQPDLFDKQAGLTSKDVKLIDPAVGTGTFLLGVMQRIARTVEADQGKGAVGQAVAAAANRLIGFELQFGPFAVAQLRLLAEMQFLVNVPGGPGSNLPGLRLFITDTLHDPDEAQAQFSSMLAPIGQSRKEANAVKRDEAITVVIGNPPYREKARGRGGWIELGSDANKSQVAPMDRWTPPPEWGASAHSKHLKNLYVYFWRWATLKVFGSGLYAATGEQERAQAGIVCFITVAGFLNGPGFQRMRDDLRRTCSAVWVIDCSPEGHQPAVGTRIFQGVQQPVCIVLAAKLPGKSAEIPARVKFRALPKGTRATKFAALATLGLDDLGWVDAPSKWREPFLPELTGKWADFPALNSFFTFAGPGVMPGRTWVISPDTETLGKRWKRLQSEKSFDFKQLLFHAQYRKDKRTGKPTLASRHLRKIVNEGLGSKLTRLVSVHDDKAEIETSVRYAFRSFDRQWLIGDARLLNDVRPVLWTAHSAGQIYLTALDAHAPTSGPAVTLTELIPDQHHYKGSFGGRVFPLWRDRAGKESNVKPELLELLAATLGQPVTAPEAIAYLASVLGHPSFTRRFAEDLVRPGLRVPLTGDPQLWKEAVELGREVVWLHTYGERFTDAGAGRPKGPPRLPPERRPTVPAEGAIPPAPEPLPEAMEYDPATRRLRIGEGFVANVSPEMVAYEVSGKNVLDQWFSYRRRDRSKPPMGDRRPPSPLQGIQPDGWLPEYTEDLINLLNVLGRVIALEPAQAALLERILAGPLIDKGLIAEALGETVGQEAEEA